MTHLSQNFFEQNDRIPLFDDKYNWNKCANNEYLNDTIIKHLSRIFKLQYPMVEGLFDIVELLNHEPIINNKIDGQGLCVLHCKPSSHYILA